MLLNFIQNSVLVALPYIYFKHTTWIKMKPVTLCKSIYAIVWNIAYMKLNKSLYTQQLNEIESMLNRPYLLSLSLDND